MADEDVRVVSGIELDRESVKLKSGCTKILRAGQLDLSSMGTHVVGGDCEALGGAEGSPSIIIEKEGDKISKIIVRCPCGRHAELLCEYEEGA